MPNYKYECNNCHNILTEFQNMSDSHLINCPECGQPALRRLIGSGVGVIFKGRGFYSTDYKKESQKKEALPQACASCDAKPGSKDCPKNEKK